MKEIFIHHRCINIQNAARLVAFLGRCIFIGCVRLRAKINWESENIFAQGSLIQRLKGANFVVSPYFRLILIITVI